MAAGVSMDTLVALCKQRGFVYPAADIYGGFANAWDYGPLGVAMRRNIRDLWWRAMVQEREDVVGLESTIITNPAVWQASGHLENFTDPLVDCRNCKARHRADSLPGWDDASGSLAPDAACPNCGMRGTLTEARSFNLMFRTFVGPVESSSSVAYLRPETAQGMFINFTNVQRSSRLKLPFGIAQIGKSFRNEITPGNFIFRSREFEQMELEYFCRPEDGFQQFNSWRDERYNWYLRIGIKPESLRRFDHPKDKLSHYSAATTDLEFQFPFGWGELEGIAYRTDFDLRQHAAASGQRLDYFDPESKEHIAPHVVEPAVGVDRILLACLVDAYETEPIGEGDSRTVLRLHPAVAPIQVAVLPLSRTPRLTPTARDVWSLLRPHFATQYDDAQAIGRRYRRQDEIGTPCCVTIDFETVEQDRAVTIRDRDSMQQERVPIDSLVSALQQRLNRF
jgi:glycyl-tRNA synthetase